MRSTFYILVLLLINSLILASCNNNYLYSKEPISIGHIGNTPLPAYTNVTVTTLAAHTILNNDTLQKDYDFLVIDPEFFETVSDDAFIDAFYNKELAVLFLGSSKAHMPFLKQAKGDVPKTYNDYNDELNKLAVLIRYGDNDEHNTSAVTLDDTLSRADFEWLMQALYK